MQKYLHLSPTKIGFILTALIFSLVVIKPGFLEILELQLIDQRFKYRGEVTPGPEVVIIAIDEKSQDVLGRWPWPRSTLATLVDRLVEANVATIGFDMVFSESGDDVYNEALSILKKNARDSSLGTLTLEVLETQLNSQKTSDQIFAESLQKANNTVLGFFFHDSKDEIVHLSAQEMEEGLKQIEPHRYRKTNIHKETDLRFLMNPAAVESNLPLFNQVAVSSGYFNLVPDPDGIMRRYPLIMKGGDHYYAPLFMQMIAHYLEEPEMSFATDKLGVSEIHVGSVNIPVDWKGNFMVNYYGGTKTFPHIPAVDVIQGKIDPEALDSRIVLVGATGTGIYDLRATPFERVYPGVEINATIIDNILQENYLRRPPSYQFFTGALVLAIGIVLSIILARMKAVTGFLISFAALAAYIFVNQELFNRGTWYNLTYPSLQIFGVYLSITAYNYFSESKQKSFIRGAFGQFLSPTVVKQLVDNPDQLKLGGDQVRMTGFFSDVAGFSTISETLTPKQLVELLNEYLTAMTDIILKYEGTIDKYEGDAIIAFWGAPIKHSDHALRACRASLAMQKKLIDMRKVWKEQGRAEMQVRIGMNTGLMVVGNMGSASRMDYTMMGDAVNLASRLEGVNKVYGTQTMVSQFTYEDVKDQLEFRELDKIRVMGKNEPVSIYEVLTEKGSLTPEQKEGFALFAKGLENYRGQLWEEAIEVFQNVQKLIPDDPPCNAFIERCRTYIKSRELSRRAEDKARVPPDDWDGVYQMTSK